MKFAKVMFLHRLSVHGGGGKGEVPGQVPPPPSPDQVNPRTRYPLWDQVHPPPGTRYTPGNRCPQEKFPTDQVHTPRPGTPWAGTPRWAGTPLGRYKPPGTRYTPLWDQVHPSLGPGTPLSGTRYTPWTRCPPETRYTPPLEMRYTPLAPGTPPIPGTPPHQVPSPRYPPRCP